jgi:hypothetical protein
LDPSPGGLTLRRYAFAFVVAGLAVSVMVGLLLTAQAQTWGMVLSTAFLLFIPATSRRAAAEIAARPRLLLFLGIGVALLGVGGMIAGICLWPVAYDERGIAFSIWPMLAGPAVAYLPFMARRMNQAWARIDEDRKAPPAPPPRFSPAGDVAEALYLLVRERLAAAKAVGPWFLLFCLLPLAFVDVAFWKDLTHRELTLALIALLGFLTAFLCLPLIAAIQWARFLATGREPRLMDVPLGAIWGFLWRLFFAGVILRAINGAEPWLKAHLPSALPWMVSGLSELFSLLVLVLASPWAMVFVAVAVGAKDKSTATALRAARGVGRRFYLGMLLILAPVILLSWLTETGSKTSDVTVADWVTFFGWSLAVFLTMIVATTYLTRIYLRNPANTGAPA